MRLSRKVLLAADQKSRQLIKEDDNGVDDSNHVGDIKAKQSEMADFFSIADEKPNQLIKENNVVDDGNATGGNPISKYSETIEKKPIADGNVKEDVKINKLLKNLFFQ